MNKMAGNFMKAAVLYAMAGIILGIVMASSHDFGMKSVHSHLNLLGWIGMAIFAFYYQLVPHAAETGAAKLHFWLTNAGVVVLTTSVAFIMKGVVAAEAGATVGSMALLVSMLLFGYIVFASKRSTQTTKQAALGSNQIA